MSYSIVGEQIQKFRKEMGLTQRELGEALGVSSSAVSQWESGGTPDVALLPAIADRLHVTIDALFGREGGEVQDMEQTACRWIRSLPEEQRLDKICRLSFAMIKFGFFPSKEPPEIGYMKLCEMITSKGEPIILPSVSSTDHGIVSGVFADDMSFAAFFPEPEKGYMAYFSSNEEYRELFRVLAQPDMLEVIMSLAGEHSKCYTPGAVAKWAGISEERAKEMLDALTKLNLTGSLDLEGDEGEISAYHLRNPFHLVPFFYFARLLLSTDAYYMNWTVRGKPLLRRDDK